MSTNKSQAVGRDGKQLRAPNGALGTSDGRSALSSSAAPVVPPPADRRGWRRLFPPTKKAPENFDRAPSESTRRTDTRPMASQDGGGTRVDGKASSRAFLPNGGRAATPPRLQESRTDTVKPVRPFPISLRRNRSAAGRSEPPMCDNADTGTPARQNRSSRSLAKRSAGEEKKSDNSDEDDAAQQRYWSNRNRDRNQKMLHEENDAVDDDSDSGSDAVSSRESPVRHDGGGQSAALAPELRILALLNRPFGRSHLPVDIARRFVADVSQAEWDADEQKWKYRVLLQNRQLAVSSETSMQVPQSFTTAFTWRSLADFIWLEKALRREFNGGLLLPDLFIALGRALDSNIEGMPVEADRLKHWLNDILNGIRGQGELILDHSRVDLLSSEAMEKFLYHSGGPLEEDHDKKVSDCKVEEKKVVQESFIQTLWREPLSIVPLGLCVGPEPLASPSKNSERLHMPLGYIACSSQAIGNAASLDGHGSIIEVDNGTVGPLSPNRPSTVLAIHSMLLESERDLALNYRKTALSAMEKLQALREEEELVGHNWKRFATCLSNLFAYEKDVEDSKLCGVKILSENMPFRKVVKSKIEDGLRLLAKHKCDRVVPALEALYGMLAAYTADLSTVGPAIDAFTSAANHTRTFDARELYSSAAKGENHARRRSMESELPPHTQLNDEGDVGVVKGSIDDLEQQVKANERLLQTSVTELCRGVPVRMSRMAWKLWTMEATECALLAKAAASLRLKSEVFNQEAVAMMIKRHLKEEKEDAVVEIDLIQRIINFGNFRIKDKQAEDPAVFRPATLLEGENRMVQEGATEEQIREKVLKIARERIGRWDSKLSLAVVEAVGVHDPHVRVEETTKELRLVRKYAIGLRDHLSRCKAAIEQIIASYSENDQSETDEATKRRNKSIRRKRTELFSELAKLFSGKLIAESGSMKRTAPSLAVLAKAGIDVSDPLNWSSFLGDRGNNLNGTRQSMGDLVSATLRSKDSQVNWLHKTLHDLLVEYHHRVEIIEGFVYMECVGIQIEKHFSQRRADALAAFEKKTDITAAMNAASRKGLKKVVDELQGKLASLGPEVSHTSVKETKDVHLEAKNLKNELHTLAIRRLNRARETSTERVVTLISIWTKEEERCANEELKALKEAMDALVRGMGSLPIEALVYRVP